MFFLQNAPPIVSSDGEYNHGVTMGLGMIPWDPKRKIPWFFPEIGHTMGWKSPMGIFTMGWHPMGTSYGVANFRGKTMGFFFWESHGIFL